MVVAYQTDEYKMLQRRMGYVKAVQAEIIKEKAGKEFSPHIIRAGRRFLHNNLLAIPKKETTAVVIIEDQDTQTV